MPVGSWSGTARTDRGPIAGLDIDGGIKRVRPVCGNLVDIRKADNVAGKRNIPGEARHSEREIRLEEPPHLLFPKTSLQDVILDGAESEMIPVTEVEGAGLRARESSGLGQNPGRQ